MTPAEAAERARDFLAFCDGLQEGGLRDYAGRGRIVARELIETLEALDAERSARRTLQARCETLQSIVGKAAYQACEEATRGR